MKKKKILSFSVFFSGFLVITIVAELIFTQLNNSIQQLNEEAMQDVGFTYLSGLSSEIVEHSKTYFHSNFESIDRILNHSLQPNDTPDSIKENLQNEFSDNTVYLALLKKNGEREVLRGDETIKPYDQEAFEDAWKLGDEKVILTTNAKGERNIEMITFQDFSIGNTQYAALLCDLNTETLNTVLDLSYGEKMVYSFIIRKKDGSFVIRNDDAINENYFSRISNRYEDYNGMASNDYIEQIRNAIAKNEDYHAAFRIDSENRMLHATQFPYSDWYIITFMRYREIENILHDSNEKRSKLFNNSFGFLFAIFLIVFCCYAIYSWIQLRKQEKLKNEAIAANRSKSEFLSNMSHDIRTPMNVIIGMTDIAQSNISDTQKATECLNKISQSSRHLLSLINDVLDMSKIESGQMQLNFSPVSLREAMENIVLITQPQIKNKNQHFDIFIQDIISEDVYCDNLRLNQVLINLLSNAVKYTPEEGSVSLRLSQENSPKGEEYVRVHIQVTDNGIGMTKDFIKVVFNSFVREDKSRVTKEEGTGLGLAITKHIVDMMEGTIEIESEPNVGSEFHVVVDLKKVESEQKNMCLNGINVLIVDDSKDLCESAAIALHELGANASYALGCNDALEILQHDLERFDIILVDWRMPDIDGIETVRRIKTLTNKSTPVVLISAYDWSDCEAKAKDVGVDGFIPKPLFKSTLFYGIHQHLFHDEHKKSSESNTVHFNGERILLAEDNALNSEIAITLLSEVGLELELAENGKICVEKFQNSPKNYYKAILMDVRMPVMNGYEATKTIRKLDRTDAASIPIIAMTADAFAEDVVNAKQAGMNAHISKPLDIHALVQLLKKYMNI